MSKFKRAIAFLLTLCMLMNIMVIGLATSAAALEITDKPENGTTTGQPFASGTGGSTNFRIPGIVTLDNGTVIAACDARWNHAGDGAGLDTIVSVSTDNGENWTYTYANYLGDNGDVYNQLSTCFIDPGIGTDGEKAYLIADLWPAGIALNTSKYSPVAGENGFDDNGNLLLRDLARDTVTIGADGYNTMAAARSYDYYLNLEDLKIYTSADVEVEGYTVDAYFNITGTDGTDTNLFFSDSPYQPYPTDYLYMTTSTDGLNWSVPELLNLQTDEEKTLLVGPGNGTYDAVNDRVIFTAYRHEGYANEWSCLIWMDGEGNWHRSENCTVDNWSSEASSVVLDDGTVRVFYRDGYSYLRYTDMVWDETAQNYVRDPDATEVGTVAAKKSGCQLTAIKYSQQIDGKDAVLVATPANSGSRADGHIYVFLVNDDNSMDLVYDYDITPNSNEYYAYSCLTELDNGGLGLLWESAGSGITYTAIPLADVTARENNVNLSFEDVKLYAGDSAAFNDTTGNYEGLELTGLDTNVASVEIKGSTTTTHAAVTLGTGASMDLEDCLFTFTKSGDYYVISSELSDGTTVYLNHYSTTTSQIPLTTESNTVAISAGTGDQAGMFRLISQVDSTSSQGASARTLHFHMEATTPYWNRCGNASHAECHEYLYRPVQDGETSSEEIPGYVRVTAVDQIQDGGQYLIAAKNNAGNWYVLNPTTSDNNLEYVAKVLGESSVYNSDITITGVGAGETEVQIGNVIYTITVKELRTENVSLEVGKTATFTDNTNNYENADTTALDTTFATVSMTGTTTADSKSAAAIDAASATLESGTYLIVNTRCDKTMTSADATWNGNSGLALDGSVSSIADAACWTITATDTAGVYTVQDSSGKYLTLAANNNAALSDTLATVTIDTYTNTSTGVTTWRLSNGGFYLNNAGGQNACAIGWNGDGAYDAPSDVGSQWALYEVISTPTAGSTVITFTGVAEGETEVQIGDVVYKITVSPDGSVPVSVQVGKTVTITDDTGNYEDAKLTGLNTSVATVSMTGTTTPASKSLSEAVTAIESGKTYVLYNTDAQKLVNNTWADASVGGGGTDGLALSSTTANFGDADCWTITAVENVENGYYVQDMNGKYLTVGAGKAGVSDDPVVISLAYEGSDWTIGEDGEYLNNYGDAGSAAAGYNDIEDPNAQWYIYEVITTPASGTTEITFTGVAEGETEVQIGDVVYKITVSSNVKYVDVELEVGDTADYVNDYQGEVWTGDVDSFDTDYVGVEIVTIEEGGVYSHEITFEGLAVGSSEIRIGDTIYRINVKAPEYDVIDMRNVSTATRAGEIPTLPETVKGVMADATLVGDYLVTWDAIDAADLVAGATVTVTGYVDVLDDNGNPMDVTCTIRVIEAAPATSTNVALNATVTQDIPEEYWSDNLASVNDGSTESEEKDSGDFNTHWSNYDYRNISDTATLTFTWDSVQSLKEFYIYFRTDNWSADLPADVDITYSVDGVEFLEMSHQSEDTMETVTHGGKYSFVLDEPINAKVVKFTFTQQEGMKVETKCVAVYEIEAYTVTDGDSIVYNSFASLSSITADGEEIDGFAADTTSYLVTGTPDMLIAAATEVNAGITVLPPYEGVVRILTVSEDGNAAKTYELTFCEHSYTNYVSNGDAKCGVDGTETAVCDNGCGTSDTRTDEGSALEHSYTNYVSNGDAKCGVDGTETAECDHGCGTNNTRTDEGSALEHSYTNYVSNGDAKCGVDGTETAECDHGCGTNNTRTDEGSALEHSFTDYVSNGDAKCGVDGTETAECDNDCGETHTRTDEGSALEHSYTNYVSNGDAKCGIDGTETAECDHGCGETHTRTDEGSALEHSFTKFESNNDATCTKDGTETAKCDHGCGETDTRTVADSALGHTEAEPVRENEKPATCTEAGSYDEVVYCDLCDEELSRTTKTTAALGHKDEDKDHKCDVCEKVLTECVDENKDYKCDICGAELEKPDSVIRLAGAHRWETAIKVADEMKANLGVEKFDTIIIASGNDFADALAGSYLSTVKSAPILLSWGLGGKYEYLDTDNIEYIKENLAEGGTVYILGGEKAVPASYETALEGYKVVRLGGANRFETNLLILKEAGVNAGDEILVCTSTNFADSLSASATGKPILLVFNNYKALYGEQPEYLATLEDCTFTIVGGESAVCAELETAIKTYGETTRLAGENRFETSVMVAEKYFENPETAVLAYAWNYPDGLCGGALAYSMDAPLILTMTKYEAEAVEYATENTITSGVVLGGDGLISDDAVRSIFAMDVEDEIIVK